MYALLVSALTNVPRSSPPSNTLRCITHQARKRLLPAPCGARIDGSGACVDLAQAISIIRPERSMC